MCVAHEQQQRSRGNGNAAWSDRDRRPVEAPRKRRLRVEIVDNWHRHWSNVRRSIDATGHAQSLRVDDAGWLSARQVLLVAFDDKSDAVAGHVCFSLAPRSSAGKITVEAHVDSFGVQPGFDRITLTGTLRAAAEKRAKALKCGTIVFDG